MDATDGDPATYPDNVQIQKAMRFMKARHVLLVFDSCYSGTLNDIIMCSAWSLIVRPLRTVRRKS